MKRAMKVVVFILLGVAAACVAVWMGWLKLPQKVNGTMGPVGPGPVRSTGGTNAGYVGAPSRTGARGRGMFTASFTRPVDPVTGQTGIPGLPPVPNTPHELSSSWWGRWG